jgi:RsiW-degrading membrane proteinase PrsW (M82 family)
MSTVQAGARRGSVARGPRSRRPLAAPLLLSAVALWLYLGFASTWSTGAAVPIAWALLGAYLVPTALVVELGRRDAGLSTVVLLRTLLVGSLLAAVSTATLGDGAPRLLGSALPGWTTGLLLPAIAEAAAVVLLVRVLGRRMHLGVRSALFLGGALGAGYAAFESLGAILHALSALRGVPLPAAAPPSALLEGAVTVQQALLLPLGHPVWGALLGAAVVVTGRRALAGTLAVVLASQLVVAGAFAVTGGLLGTGPAALVVQTALTAAVAWPALLALRTVARRTRPVAAEPRTQAGGA